jgi:hypothetical protein
MLLIYSATFKSPYWFQTLNWIVLIMFHYDFSTFKENSRFNLYCIPIAVKSQLTFFFFSSEPIFMRGFRFQIVFLLLSSELTSSPLSILRNHSNRWSQMLSDKIFITFLSWHSSMQRNKQSIVTEQNQSLTLKHLKLSSFNKDRNW